MPHHRPHERSRIVNYLVPAIRVTLLCCNGFGIPALIHAAQVNNKIQLGDVAGALDYAKKAKIWTWVAFGLGLVGILSQLLLLALPAFLGSVR